MGCNRLYQDRIGNDNPSHPHHQVHPVDQEELHGGNGSHTTDEEESEDNREPVVIHNSVKYCPSSEDTVRLDYDSKPTTSMARMRKQLEQEMRNNTRDSTKYD